MFPAFVVAIVCFGVVNEAEVNRAIAAAASAVGLLAGTVVAWVLQPVLTGARILTRLRRREQISVGAATAAGSVLASLGPNGIAGYAVGGAVLGLVVGAFERVITKNKP